jgi:hypothetical protein
MGDHRMKRYYVSIVLSAFLLSLSSALASATTTTNIEFEPITAFGNSCNRSNVFPTAPGYFADYGSAFGTASSKLESRYSANLYTATESGWINYETQKPEDMTALARYRGFGSWLSNPDHLFSEAPSNTACNNILSNLSLSDRYRTFLYMQNPNTDGAWRIQVPAGQYSVQFVAGDPYFTGGVQTFSCGRNNPFDYQIDTFSFDLNGTNVPLTALLNQIDPKSCDSTGKNCDLLVDPNSKPATTVEPTGCSFSGFLFWGQWDCSNSRLWFKGTETVTVTAVNSDGSGYLTLSNHHDSKGNIGSYNNKINFINVTPVASSRSGVPGSNDTVGAPVILPTLSSAASSTNAVTDLIQLNDGLVGIGSVTESQSPSTTKPLVWLPNSQNQYPTATDLDPSLSFTDTTIQSEVPLQLNDLGDILGLIRFYEPNSTTPQSELVVWHPISTTAYGPKIVLPFLSNSDITSSFVENGVLLSNGDVVGDAYGIFTDSYAENGTESYFRATLYWKENSDGSYQAPIRLLTSSISDVYFSTLATVGANGNVYGSVVFLPNYTTRPVVWIKNADGTYQSALDISAAAGNIGSNAAIYESAFEDKYLIGSGGQLVIQDNDGGFGNPQYYVVTPTANGLSYGPGVQVPSLTGIAINQIYLANYTANTNIFEYNFNNALSYFGLSGQIFGSQVNVPFAATLAPLYDGEVINNNGGMILQSLTNTSQNYFNYPNASGNYVASNEEQLQNPPNFADMVITYITDNAIYGQVSTTSGGVTMTLPVVWVLTP